MSAMPVRVDAPIEPREAPRPVLIPQTARATRRAWYAGVVLACMVGAALVLGATARGVGLSPDSVQYLAAANSASEGHGLITYAWEGEAIPLTHFPPAYSLILAAVTRAGLSSEAFARWFNIALFAMTIVGAVVITRRLVPRSSWPAVTVAGLLAVAPDLVAAHSMVWTEPLYLTLTLFGLLALVKSIERRALLLLLAAGVLAGVSSTVRYVGAANIAVVSLAVLLWWRAVWWRRVGLAGAVGLVAALPLLLVLIGGARGTDLPVANREFIWHPIGLADVRMAAAVVGKWVSPLNDATYLTAAWLLVVALVAGAVVALARRGQSRNAGEQSAAPMLARALVLYGATYLAVLVLSMSFVDAQTLFDARLLLPLLPIAAILGVSWLARMAMEPPVARRATFVLLTLVFAAGLSRVLPWTRAAYSEGLALRRLDSDDRPLVLATRRLPETARIYSNRPFFLRVQTSHMVLGVPRARHPNSLLPNPQFEQQVREICDRAASRATYVALYKQSESEDPTATVHGAFRHGQFTPLRGGFLVRMLPGCGAASR